MTSTIRLRTEARILFWPWCAVIAAAFSRFIPQPEFLPNPRLLAIFGFWLGIPLLATLSLGMEFQKGTLSSLLSQPIGRFAMWKEKLVVTELAVLSAALVFGVVWWSDRPSDELFASALWLIVSMCSATYWTLVTRSAIGSITLNISLYIMAFAILGSLVPAGFGNWNTSATVLGILTLCYSALMLWLGYRKWSRFEISGSTAASWFTMGNVGNTGIVGGLVQSRRNEPTLNLIRREIRLLWPLWLLTGMGLALVVCLAPLVRAEAPTHYWIPGASVTVALLYATIAAVLAGAVPVTEERAFGTHQWHLILPVSIWKQWGVKLAVAVLSSLGCAAGILEVARVLLGPDFRNELGLSLGNVGEDVLLFTAILTLAAFWSATLLKGTLRAVLWLFPAIGLLSLASTFGFWLGRDALAGSTLVEAAMSRFYPFPVAFHGTWIRTLAYIQTITSPLVALPLLLMIAWQSYRQFRTEPSDRASSVVRRLIGPAAFVLAGCFALQAPVGLTSVSDRVAARVLEETFVAVEALNLPARKGEVETLRFPLSALHQVHPLSDLTRRWLKDAPVTVQRRLWTFATPQQFHDGTSGSTTEGISISLNVGGGWKCNIQTGMFNGRYDHWNCRGWRYFNRRFDT